MQHNSSTVALPINPIAIGYWKSKLNSTLPDINQFVTLSISDAEREELVAYLKSGNALNSWMGYSFCRFNCGIADADMGASCLTDGTFIWPEGLAHYVEHHNVWLPERFIEHAHKNFGKDYLTLDISRVSDGDYSWWMGFTRLI